VPASRNGIHDLDKRSGHHPLGSPRAFAINARGSSKVFPPPERQRRDPTEQVPVSALRGILKSRRRRPETVEEMNQAITEGASGVRRLKTRGIVAA
jgi:hypothetical protein